MTTSTMSNHEKVTVDRAYFEALLRRADFHTSTQVLGRPDPANITISRVEYDSLLRTSRDYEVLRNALIQGGVTEENLNLLTSQTPAADHRKDSGTSIDAWNQDSKNSQRTNSRLISQSDFSTMRSNGQSAAFCLAPGTAAYRNGNTHLRVPNFQRQASFGMSSGGEDNGFDDEEDFDDDNNARMMPGANYLPTNGDKRTLYFSGFSERTTYRDLLSVIKGGKVLSINLRSERSATVSFLEGATEFLAWAKRNDLYLHSKRVEVKWADRQFQLNTHIGTKIANGATRNILIRSAVEKSLTEAQIRADMEHIHNLVVIDIKFRQGDAYVSMNSVHNALFARTCMMSRKEYKGCKIEFFADECDVPLPQSVKEYERKVTRQIGPVKRRPIVTNRFDMLNIDGTEGSSDEENHSPSDEESDNETTDESKNRFSVNLNFLDSESA